jgi:hypothetical protein
MSMPIKVTRNDITVQQGATYRQVYQRTTPEGEIIVLSGYTAKASLKAKHSDATSLLDFTCTITPSEGKITVSATSTQTAALEAPLDAVWDLLLINGAEVERLVEGKAAITPGVTAP